MLDDIKKTLWAAADKLRANMDAAEYKHLVLGLIFLKARSLSAAAQRVFLMSSSMENFQCNTAGEPQHFLNFLPLPQGQASLRPTFGARRWATSRS